MLGQSLFCFLKRLSSLLPRPPTFPKAIHFLPEPVTVCPAMLKFVRVES